MATFEITKKPNKKLATIILHDSQGNEVKVNELEINQVLDLQSWFNADPCRDVKHVLILTADEFDSFMIKKTKIKAETGSIEEPPTQMQTQLDADIFKDIGREIAQALSTSTPTSPADQFDKSTKRSVGDYKQFKDSKFYNSWYRHFRFTAREHDCWNILQAEYVPVGTDAQELFDRQQKFMFNVLSSTLQEPTSLEILRRYTNPNEANFGNAQKLLAELHTTMTTDIVDVSRLQTLEKTINERRFNPLWNKSTESFVISMGRLLTDHYNMLKQNTYDDSWYR